MSNGTETCGESERRNENRGTGNALNTAGEIVGTMVVYAMVWGSGGKE